jgi:alkylhydroperoxidase/carboxymuconolactone decarboxylase family protein YurZ
MDNLNKLSKMGKLAPEAMTTFRAYDKAALADGAIPKKYEELMANRRGSHHAMSICIEVHRQAALKVGVAEQEQAEGVFGASALRAGAAITHGTHLIGG